MFKFINYFYTFSKLTTSFVLLGFLLGFWLRFGYGVSVLVTIWLQGRFGYGLVLNLVTNSCFLVTVLVAVFGYGSFGYDLVAISLRFGYDMVTEFGVRSHRSCVFAP